MSNNVELITLNQIENEVKKSEILPEKLYPERESKNDLVDSLQQFISARNLKNPYYKFNTQDDKFNEYERCYRVSAARYSASNDQDETRMADIIFPDYHKVIENIVVRAMNIFNSGGEVIQAKVRRKANNEYSALAMKLFNYSTNCVEDYSLEQRKIITDWANFGTFCAFTPYKEDPEMGNIKLDYEIDEEENPVKDELGFIKEVNPYDYQFVKGIKRFTDLKHLDPRDLIVNPLISKVQKQPKIYIRIRKTYEDLLEWEEAGIIGKDQADYIKDNYSKDSHASEQGTDNKNITDDNTTMDQEKDNAFDVYLCFYKQKEQLNVVGNILKFFGIKQRVCIYQAVICNDTVIEGSEKKTDLKRYPVIKGVLIPDGDNWFGIGAGDQMYSVYIAKNTRNNQIFDKSSYEVKGGGLKDARVPSMQGIKPGMYRNVPGLNSFQGKPVLSINDLGGNSAIGQQIIPTLDEAMQSGTGVTNLLQGMPTDSGLDKTATGVQAGIAESNARLNAYIELLEDQLFAEYARQMWFNYQDNDFQDYIHEVLDPEDLFYTDKDGNEVPVNISEALPDIDIEFTGVKRILDKERRANGIKRFLQDMGMLGQFNPSFGEYVMNTLDYDYAKNELANTYDIGDIDKLFPKQKQLDFINQIKSQAQQAGMENQLLKTAVEIFIDKAKSTGNKFSEQQFQTAMQEAGQMMELANGNQR